MKAKLYLIVDDSPQDALRLQNQMVRFPFYKLLSIVTSVQEAIELLATELIDLIFLDVHLVNESGLTLLKAGLKLPSVIVTSALTDPAIESYEIGVAADYLLKPFTHERLQLALNRAMQTKTSADSIVEVNAIFLKMGRKVQRFSFDAIDYVEAYGLYSKVHVGSHYSVVNERMNVMAQLLPSRQFMRVHKSYLINIDKITSYDRQNLWINQMMIPIGISFRPKLLGLLSLFEGSSGAVKPSNPSEDSDEGNRSH